MQKYCFFLSGFFITSQVFSYSAESIRQFTETNQCIHCNLIEAELDEKNHNQALLTGSDLSKARMRSAQFNEADITTCQLVRTNVDESSFRGTQFDGSNFSFFSGRYAAFNQASFKHTDMTYAKLYAANFTQADFTDADLHEADMNHTILIGSNITPEQLATIKSLHCAVLPDGRVYNPGNRKCRDF